MVESEKERTDVRKLFITSEVLSRLGNLLLLTDSEIKTFQRILLDSENEKFVDLYLTMMNELDITDDEAELIYEGYAYLNSILVIRDLTFVDILPDLMYKFSSSSISGKNEIIANVQNNKDAFSDLFGPDSIEGRLAKRHFLETRIANSVYSLRSICDLRPVFNSSRESIVDYIYTTSIEFIVTDDLNQQKVVSINLDKNMLNQLKNEIDIIEKKHKMIEDSVKLSKGEGEHA